MHIERKNQPHYQVKDRAFAIIKPEPVRLVPILDVGMDGIGVHVKDEDQRLSEAIKRLNRFLTGYFNDIWGRAVSPQKRLYDKFGINLDHVMALNDPKGVYAYCLVCDIE